jgi:hypothetical protein
MNGQPAQQLLVWISTAIALLTFVVSVGWQFHHSSERDWVEKLGQAVFHVLQALVWGGLATVIVLHFVGVPLGGSR